MNIRIVFLGILCFSIFLFSCISPPFEQEKLDFFGDQYFAQAEIPDEYRTSSNRKLLILKERIKRDSVGDFTFFMAIDTVGSKIRDFSFVVASPPGQSVNISKSDFWSGLFSCLDKKTYNDIKACVSNLMLQAMKDCDKASISGTLDDIEKHCWMNIKE